MVPRVLAWRRMYREVVELLKRMSCWLCCLVVLLSCANGSNQGTAGSGVGKAAGAGPAAQAPTPLTLTLWHPWSGRKEQALYTLARAFEQLHPDIRIRLEAHPVASLVHDYAALAADAGAPQLLLIRGRYVGELVSSQHLLPLDTVVPTSTLSLLIPAALANAEVRGHPYGIPLSLDALVFWYDRRMLAHPPASLDSLLAAPGAVNSSLPVTTTKLAYHLSLITTLPYFYALDGQLQNVNDGIALATSMRPAAIRWLNWLRDLLAQSQARATDDLALVDRALQTGHAWSAIDWSYQGPEYEAVWGKENLAVAPLPPTIAGSKLPPTLVGADVLCVNPVTRPDQQSAAYAFIRYMVSEAAQTNLGTLAGVVPANSHATVDQATRVLRSALTTAVAEPTTLDSRSWAVLNDMVQSVLTGNAVPEQALDAAAVQLRQGAP